MRVPGGRYLVQPLIGYCPRPSYYEVASPLGLAVTFIHYAPTDVAVGGLYDGWTGVDLSGGGSVVVTVGLHWFSEPFEGISPVSPGGVALPGAGAGQHTASAGVPSGPAWAAAGLLGLSGALMAAWIVSGRLQKRRPDA